MRLCILASHVPLAALVVFLVVSGCGSDTPMPARCASSTDCSAGLTCIDGRCTGSDAGGLDASGGDAGTDAGPAECAAPCAGDTHCVAGACVAFAPGEIIATCTAPSRPFAVAPRALCHWPALGVPMSEGPAEWRWARAVASTVVAGTFLPPVGEFDVPPTWLVFATGSVLSGQAEDPTRWMPGGVLRVLDPQTCTLIDTLDEVPVAAWFEPPAIGDLDGDGTPEIVAQAWDGDLGAPDASYASSGELVAWRWDPALSRFRVWRRSTVAGAPERDLIYTAGYQMMAGPTIADLDDDGAPEVLLAGRVYDHELRRLSGEAPPITPLFMSRPAPGGPYVIQEDVVADLDDDGRAELVYGHAIFTWSGSAWTPAPFFSPPVALGAAHGVVVDLGELTGSPPGAPEIVAVGYDGVRIQTLGGTVLRTFALLTGDRGGSAPSIANVDDDPEPEILVGVDAGLFVYDLECDADPTPAGCGIDTTPGAGRPTLPRGVRWADRPPYDAFDFMGATTFDFDADGDVEVVYADECFLRVYDGTSGEVLYSHWRPSRTASEVPVVVGTGDGADTVIAIGLHTAGSCTQATGVGGVPAYDPQFPGLGCVSDLDCFGPAGSCRAGRCRCTADAECCAPGSDCASVGFACHPSEDADGNTCRAVRVPDASAFARYGALEEGIDVLTDAFGRWAPARAIWNQDAYSITNVGDDGSIPRTSEVVPSWTPAGFRTFRSNVAGPGGAAAAADLRIAPFPCAPYVGDTFLDATICNRGRRGAPAGQRVSFENDATRAPLCEVFTGAVVAPGACVTVHCDLATPIDSSMSVRMAVAEDGRLPECGGATGNVLVVGTFIGCE